MDDDGVTARPDHREPVQPARQPREVGSALGVTTSALGGRLDPEDDSIP